mmetsp:Transcript_89016/g.133476  ORF Transcript_89016/g.133476 Transcript_89016/m.133476 type:complete len:1274 (+) Transcript_89016:218-4039(+)|eukprot:CAMPEP_0117044848 /NCGR_PEP_ID=MMETSP0472-20121206/31058_1 /TAXON_ID=693140 ORGANISM="Tiarina fusus, Strain LIS" /NCGR_SAMPLE_ID=MMETSP0472 /ASSEMBLY_ACC=CAM_ASM_000603 /LENGTH=1273 /DNA_ID=CAMNT_0004756687 /DNA_START=218 /DNA_END=4039 /DNA_ORIENTATION=-
MPTQSRGFFSCDFCGLSHDTYEEAKDHEVSQCPQRPPGNRAQPQPGPPPYYRGPPPPYGAGMGPLSGAEAEGYPPPYGHGPPHHEHPPYPPYKMRSMPLMGPHDRANLSMEDSIACQNIELFEATPEHVADHDPSRSGGTPVVVKQVGLRCVHCSKSPLSSAGYSTVFPGSLGSIAASVRMVADNHLSSCSMAPPEIREACDRAANKRRREGDNEGRHGDDEEEGSRLALLDYCVGFCQQLGIVNKQPHKTGIEFADNGEMGQHYGGHPAETPNGPRGAPPHPYSAERMGPASAERMGYPGGPPGHRHGGMMGGPMGPGEGIAPTPLQRRRDRPGEGERPPYSAEREGGPPPGGYPTPYSQGGPPGSEHYPGQDGAGVQTPQQPNFEGQEGQGYPTPHSAHEGGSPGYQQFDLPSNFPFYQESNRTWHCKFCSHVHPQYRDPQSVWSSPAGTPPPGNFIDQHLSMCRAYHQSMPSPPMYQGPPPPYGPPFMGQHMHPYGPPGPWEGHSPTHAGMHPPHYPPQYPGGPGEPPFPYPPHHPEHASRYPGAEDAYGDPRARPGGHPMGPPGMPGAHGPPGMPPHAAIPPGGMPGRPGSAAGAPARKENMADSMRHAINLLVAREGEYYAREPAAAKLSRLVLDEDRLLLTEYFFFLMKQLRLCRFSESDRKTRGGKREKIKIGYGGLQCIHCADVPNSRKFFWSNVDRLANSFAEIPGHVLKCRRCPQQTKDALLQLKQYHPEQMARLPRGSQKVFFRRMWRRLHDEDPEGPPVSTPTPEKSDTENVAPEEVEKTKGEKSPSGTKMKTEEMPVVANGVDEAALVVQRSAKEAAKALAVAAEQNQPLTPSSRVVLAIPEDKEWLSDMDCFIRKQLEVFCANQDDVATAQNDRKYPVFVGQVGIRCIHCSMAKGATGTAVAFPYAISQIYESVREFQRLHLDSCENLPAATKSKLAAFKGSSSLSSVLRKYYLIAAKALGLHDTREGIHPGGESVPLGSQAAFSFSDGAGHNAEEPKFSSEAKTVLKSEVPSPAVEKKAEEPAVENETEEPKAKDDAEENSAAKDEISEETTEEPSAAVEAKDEKPGKKTEEASADMETEEGTPEKKAEEPSADMETEEKPVKEKSEKKTEEASGETDTETDEGKPEEKSEAEPAEKEAMEAPENKKTQGEAPSDKEAESTSLEKDAEESPKGQEDTNASSPTAEDAASCKKSAEGSKEKADEAAADSAKLTDDSSKDPTPADAPEESSKKRPVSSTSEGERPAKIAKTLAEGDVKEV